MRRLAIACFLFAIGIARTGAAQQGGNGAEASRSDSQASNAKAVAADYVLQSQDLIRVDVYREPDLLKESRISQEFTVVLPLIKSVDLKNKTARQAAEEIRRLYEADFLVNPQVTVTVLEYAPRTVAVSGAVANPGLILFPKEETLDLVRAIAKAGDFTRIANKKKVTLKRVLPNGDSKTYEINVEDLMKGESTSAEKWALQPDDVIFVPERFL